MSIGDLSNELERNFRKSKQSLLTMLFALTVPILIAGTAIYFVKNTHNGEFMQSEAHQIAKLLVHGLRDPVLKQDVESGAHIVSSAVQDPYADGATRARHVHGRSG